MHEGIVTKLSACKIQLEVSLKIGAADGQVADEVLISNFCQSRYAVLTPNIEVD